MPIDIQANRQVASLTVNELTELIRQTVRRELEQFLIGMEQDNTNELPIVLPPERNIDIVIGRMEATGKYNKKFLTSLRKGMARSRSFQARKKISG